MTAASMAEEHPMSEDLFDYETGRTLRGSALFIDVRKSSRIIDFVERHHGAKAATALFMNFLVGAMEIIDGPTVYECSPSGDAVLALFVGDDRKSDAIDAARRVLAFVRNEFLRENRKYLTCRGECGLRQCPAFLPFQVGAGIDDGDVTAAMVYAGKHSSRQLVGGCVSFASKLSGAAPPDSIVVSTGMFHREPLLADRYPWKNHAAVVGNVDSRIVLIDPPT